MHCEIIRQAKECPKLYADFLRRIGGINPYGKPNFRLVWGESATDVIWGQKENGSAGQHVKLRYNNIPRWHLEMWKPAELFGSPETWYAESFDPITGLHVCGDFPFEGDYTHHTRLHDLNFRILEELIPKIHEARNMTIEQRKKIINERLEAEKLERLNRGRDAYLDATPAFGGAASSIESNHEAWMQKIAEKQAGFNVSAQQIKQRMGTGHQQVRL
jgi:hypothetical protein